MSDPSISVEEWAPLTKSTDSEDSSEEQERQPWNWIVTCGGSGGPWPTDAKADPRQQVQRPLQWKTELAKGESGLPKLMQMPGIGSTGPGLSLLEVKRVLSGIWQGDRSETYSVNLKNDDNWTCTRHDGEGGEKGFPLYWEQETCLVWWGKTYFLDARELQASGSVAHWHPTPSRTKRSFVWRRISELAEPDTSQWQ